MSLCRAVSSIQVIATDVTSTVQHYCSVKINSCAQSTTTSSTIASSSSAATISSTPTISTAASAI